MDRKRTRAPSKGYIVLSEDIINELNHHYQRTGLSVREMAERSGVRGLKRTTLSCWVLGTAKYVNEKKLTTALSAWRTLPSNPVANITEEVKDHIQSEIGRTGLGIYAVLRGNSEAKNAGITAQHLGAIVHGQARKITAKQLEVILKLWKDHEERTD